MSKKSEKQAKKITKKIDALSRRSLFHAYLAKAGRVKSSRIAIIDGDEKTYSYKDITRGALAIGGTIARRTRARENVGVLLPTGIGTIITYWALMSRGRVPAMLNFTAGIQNLRHACRAAQVSHIVTSRLFY